MKRYDILYVDPPWFYPSRNSDRKFGIGVEAHYPTLKIKEIANIPVSKIVKDDALLFMWVTAPTLLPSINFKDSINEILKSWGFIYCTIAFTWIKLNKDGSIFKGPGHYTKANAEFCILARKGRSLPIKDRTVSQIVMTEKGRHSEKPEEVRARIMQMYGKQDYVELFARKQSPGWDVWGNEVNNSFKL